ncbi:ankyrin-3-like [Anneissia japonica]|uniref:ankyrin-3-like n=1 Tax=Anneissia japonica TaxID=1529436 RepID=UPI001425ACBF|nr:ankyrin-3-like [Anneissia japonica]
MGNIFDRNRNSPEPTLEHQSSDIQTDYKSVVNPNSIDKRQLMRAISSLKNEIPKGNAAFVEEVLKDLVVVSFQKDALTTRLLALSWTSGLMCAAAHGQKNIMELYLKYGEELNLTQNGEQLDLSKKSEKYLTIGSLPCGRSSFENLASTCSTCTMRLNLRNRTEGNHIQGVTPLHITVDADNMVCSKLLIEYGADVNAPDDKGMLPIFQAARKENGRMFRFLLNAGSDLNAKSNDKRTILHHAVNTHIHRSDFATKQYILKMVFKSRRGRRLNINGADLSGDTPLHIAARNSNPSAVRFLIGKGARADIPNKQNQTPFQLFIAYMGYLCYNRILIICELLKTMNRVNLVFNHHDWIPRILRPTNQRRTERVLFSVLNQFINQPFSLQLLCKRVIKQNKKVANWIVACNMSISWLGITFGDYDDDSPEGAIKQSFPDNPHWS